MSTYVPRPKRDNLVKVELCAATAAALQKVGFRDFTIRLNDRRVLEGLARRCGFAEDRHGAVFVSVEKLHKIGRDGVVAELRVHGHDEAAVASLDAVLAGLTAPLADAAAFRTALAPGADEAAVYDGLASIAEALAAASGGSYRVQLDPTLVRGMGYYTGPVFEIVHRAALLKPRAGHDAALRDVDVLREFLTGGAILAFCDLPWARSIAAGRCWGRSRPWCEFL